MKNINSFFLLCIGLLFFNCSEDDTQVPCPQTETISMQINGETKEFTVYGRGIDLDNDGSGHTLGLWLSSGVFASPQDTYTIILKLPYKKTGANIVEEFTYIRAQNGSSAEGNFVEAELESNVTVNTNTCFSATFSGRATIGGNEIIITEGNLSHIYNDPFD